MWASSELAQDLVEANERQDHDALRTAQKNIIDNILVHRSLAEVDCRRQVAQARNGSRERMFWMEMVRLARAFNEHVELRRYIRSRSISPTRAENLDSSYSSEDSRASMSSPTIRSDATNSDDDDADADGDGDKEMKSVLPDGC